MTTFDPLAQRYPSQRFPLYARRGMVNCSSPQAAAAGLEALRRGGNAIDAAVSAAAALTVTEPTANGLGSDAFALVWSEREQKLFGLNASGPAPMLADARKVLDEGRDEKGRMPRHGWTPVTVPGAVGAWAALTARFGRRSLAQDLSEALRYAREGYPCAPNLASAWQRAFAIYQESLGEPCFGAWSRTFAPQGRAPEAGELIRLPDHADTLEEIGRTDGESFYRGELAKRIDAESRRSGGWLRYEDLAAYRPLWVEPIRLDYRGWEVCEIPPNGQGIVALMALNILKEFDFPEKDSPLTVHRQIEALKMAFADAFACVTDPAHMQVDPQALLDPACGARRAAQMTERARVWSSALPPRSGTVYLCCADGEGNMVSYIQSNYMGFGSGIVIDGTGIALQNRGADFSLDPASPNVLRPCKRSYHTIIPGFLMKDGAPVGPFGVMGGYMQPQGHVQVVMGMVDFHLDPQQALDAPRFQWLRDGSVTVESRFDPELARALQRRGHDLRVDLDTAHFGRGQIIQRLPGGVLVGGTESRTDSNIALW
ncbi:MAG: gamma-glutamyltransferase family protein [Oscillospiraceae bacterium]|nr:gamma-glutamyltransferase family protein [Oscillospiraceae bacterium]